ncbi:uncharacterized protein TNCV_4463751 [Trichonephila clavipes]|nr:uncharacterized protein TNCV_4463751 [Trichonephila clavipes]
MDGSQISCAALRALALNSREQLIRKQREDPELGHIYRYLENPDNSSINAIVCEGRFQDFKLINGLRFYAKYFTTLGELRVFIPRSLRETIMKELHDLPLAEGAEYVGRNIEKLFEEARQSMRKQHNNWEKYFNRKRRRPNNTSKGSQSTAGPSHPRDSRHDKPPTEGSRHEVSGQYDKARETSTTTSGTNRADETSPVRSKKATTVRPCPYYLRSRV